MLEALKKEANITHTENGAVTYASTGSACLDLFATVGALRQAPEREIIARFIRAYAESPDTAMKLLFFARDVRGGLGERRVFRAALKWLAENEPQSVRKNVKYIADFGRFDDLLSLLATPCEEDTLSLLREQLQKDMRALKTEGGEVSLLGKWLPSANASSPQTVACAKRVAKALGLNDAAYRKALNALRARIRIIENNLRERDYSFDYEKQPSKALFKYRKAFLRNDRERYTRFLAGAAAGHAALHADHVAPYELIAPYIQTDWPHGKSWLRSITPDEKAALNATWAALPDFGNKENALAIIDTSGSMYCDARPLPAAVALSLGLYLAQRSKGAFSNHFIQFSARPQLIQLKGDTFVDRLRYACSFCEIANTNLEAVFDLILRAAVKNRVPQEELPAKLVIISDMEFDACVQNASAVNFKRAKEKYAAYGYRLPPIVFWNVASRNRQQPVTANEQGVALVSGVTPRLFSMIAGGIVSPLAFMKEVLESPRYAMIAA